MRRPPTDERFHHVNAGAEKRALRAAVRRLFAPDGLAALGVPHVGQRLVDIVEELLVEAGFPDEERSAVRRALEVSPRVVRS